MHSWKPSACKPSTLLDWSLLLVSCMSRRMGATCLHTILWSASGQQLMLWCWHSSRKPHSRVGTLYNGTQENVGSTRNCAVTYWQSAVLITPRLKFPLNTSFSWKIPFIGSLYACLSSLL